MAAPLSSAVKEIGSHSLIRRERNEMSSAVKKMTEKIQVDWTGLLINMIINYIRPKLIAGRGRMEQIF